MNTPQKYFLINDLNYLSLYPVTAKVVSECWPSDEKSFQASIN